MHGITHQYHGYRRHRFMIRREWGSGGSPVTVLDPGWVQRLRSTGIRVDMVGDY